MNMIKNEKLKNLCIKIGSGSTPKGGNSVYLESGNFSLIRSQNIHNNGFNIQGLAYISDSDAERLKGVSVELDDVLINITGDSVARVSSPPVEILPARVNQHVAILRTDKSKLDSQYLKYYLIQKDTQEHLLSLASAGATRNALTKSMLEDLKIPLVDLQVQKQIAGYLKTLDDKIRLNTQTNQTLEHIAQALFKSWFIDFDPVKAKAAVLAEGGSPQAAERAAMCAISGKNDAELDEMQQTQAEAYRQLAATAALFPCEMEDSELGEIPKGWNIRALDQIAHYQNGLALQKFRPENEADFLPVVKIAQIKQGYADNTEKASPNINPKCIIDNGDIVFSWSGSLVVDIWCGGRAALNQHLFKVTSQNYPKWFYYLYTRHHLTEFQRIAADKAVTMGHIKREHLAQAKCVVPQDHFFHVVSIFENLLEEIINQRLENSTLSETRDALLPQLLSGSLPLPDEAV
ncbi:MAG: restriction endonuclease subunit S [Eikenella sp.]|nr:restriction endonuclease subunit S [Eikenella sp.]